MSEKEGINQNRIPWPLKLIDLSDKKQRLPFKKSDELNENHKIQLKLVTILLR